MAYLYPYGDSQQLNLSWFLAKFKDLYEYVMNLDPGEASMDTILSRFTDQYDPTTTYVAGDYCIFDGYIYKANQTTSGMFNSGAWDPALPVNDIQGLRILISQLSQSVEDLEEDAVTNVQYTPGPATANGLLQKKVNGSASTVMTVDKEPTNNSQNPVKSGAVYKELTEIKGSLNTVESAIAIIANGNTHAAITSGQYVYIKNHSSLSDGLYKAVTAIPLNDTLSSTNVSAVANGGLNDLIPEYQTGNADTFFEGSYTALNGMRWAKSGKVVTAYFDVHYQDGSGTIMGTVKPEFRPNTGGNYVFATLFDTTADVYKPVGAVWIYDNGTCRAYFEPNTYAKYASITYVTA